MIDINKLSSLIAEDEGFRGRLYKDCKGFNTIGFGFNVDKNDLPKDIAILWLNKLIKGLEKDFFVNLSLWNTLNDARKYVLINMAYHIGIHGVFKFKEMMLALEVADYEQAAKEMKNSEWYVEFTSRASRLVNIMISGEF